jgi:LSD1 subclass zinc finger protein
MAGMARGARFSSLPARRQPGLSRARQNSRSPKLAWIPCDSSRRTEIRLMVLHGEFQCCPVLLDPMVSGRHVTCHQCADLLSMPRGAAEPGERCVIFVSSVCAAFLCFVCSSRLPHFSHHDVRRHSVCTVCLFPDDILPWALAHLC